MKPSATIELRPHVLWMLRENPQQMNALCEEVLREGRWESCDGAKITYDSFGDTLFVEPYAVNGDGSRSVMILMGIEKDGYCHS